VDEIPEKWKSQLKPEGVLRYRLFTEELSNVDFTLGKSEKSAMAALR
jgi:hypothetical protein